jgi:hypothetical protein
MLGLTIFVTAERLVARPRRFTRRAAPVLATLAVAAGVLAIG